MAKTGKENGALLLLRELFELFEGADLERAGEQAQEVGSVARKAVEYAKSLEKIMRPQIEDGTLAARAGFAGKFREDLLGAIQGVKGLDGQLRQRLADATGREVAEVEPLLFELSQLLLADYQAAAERLRSSRKEVVVEHDLPLLEQMLASNSGSAAAEEQLRCLGTFERLNCAEWAMKRRVRLEAGSAQQRYDADATPAMMEIAEEISHGKAKAIVIPKISQCGASTLVLNEICRSVDSMRQENIIYVCESESKSKGMMHARVLPTLHRLFDRADIFTRDSTIHHATGRIIFGGVGGKQSSLASTPARLVIMDEAARFGIGKEGSMLDLGMSRTKTFPDGKCLYLSTPITPDDTPGSFHRAMEMTDWRKYYMPCLHCGHEWQWRFENIVKQPTKKADAVACPRCSKLMQDGKERDEAVRRGRWVPTKKGRPGYIGYQITGLAMRPSFGYSLRELVQQEAAARDGASIETFFQQRLGEFFEPEIAQRINQHELADQMQNERPYLEGRVPNEVAFLTASMDCQQDFLSVEIYGHSINHEMWSIERHEKLTWRGHVLRIGQRELVVEALRALLEREFLRENGDVHKIELMGIDAGYAPEEVRLVAGAFSHRILDGNKRLYGQGYVCTLRGAKTAYTEHVIEREPGSWTSSTHHRETEHDFIVGTDHVKRAIDDARGKDYDESGGPIHMRVHCPTGPSYTDAYFAEHTAERVVPYVLPTGKQERIYKLIGSRRNEATDHAVYNRALAQLVVGPRPWKPSDWDHKLEASVTPPTGADGQPADPYEFWRWRDYVAGKGEPQQLEAGDVIDEMLPSERLIDLPEDDDDDDAMMTAYEGDGGPDGDPPSTKTEVELDPRLKAWAEGNE